MCVRKVPQQLLWLEEIITSASSVHQPTTVSPQDLKLATRPIKSLTAARQMLDLTQNQYSEAATVPMALQETGALAKAQAEAQMASPIYER